MSELSSIYPSTINRAYYIASFLMRDENLTMDVLKESYAQVGQYAEMLKEGAQVQALVDRIVSAQALEDLRLKDNVSYQAFYQAEGEDHSFYIDRDKLEPFVPKTDPDSLDQRGTSPYDKAAGRFVTTLRLQPQPQSDAAFLYYYVEMSVKEIAAAMDVSEEVVQGHLHASNVKLMADAENWMKQGRIPVGIDTIPFLIWALKRDAQRNPYRGVNLLKVLSQTAEDTASGQKNGPSRRETAAEQRAEQELAGDSRSVGRSDNGSENGSPMLSSDEQNEKAIRPGKEVSAPLKPHRSIRSERQDQQEESPEDDTYSGKKRLQIPVVPILVAVLILLVVVVIAAGLHHRNTVAEQTASSSEKAAVSSESREKESKTSSSSASSASSASSSSSESSKTYDDPADDPDGYIFPNSDKEYLQESDLEGMDARHLRLARNELYARHGVTFGMKDLQDYFDKKSWYKPKVSINDFDSSIFNKYENANLKLILKYEQQAQ